MIQLNRSDEANSSNQNPISLVRCLQTTANGRYNQTIVKKTAEFNHYHKLVAFSGTLVL